MSTWMYLECHDHTPPIRADSEADRPMDLYTLNVHEARTLAHAVLNGETHG